MKQLTTSALEVLEILKRRARNLNDGRVVYMDSWNRYTDEVEELKAKGYIKLDPAIGHVLGTHRTIVTYFGDDDVTPAEAIERLMMRFTPTEQQVVRTAFENFAKTRKSKTVSPTILGRQLRAYMEYAPWVVLEGLKIYNEMDIQEGGPSEAYALGIIRSRAKEARKALSVPEEFKRGGSDVLWGKRESDVIERNKEIRKRQVQVDEKVVELAGAEGKTIDQLTPKELQNLRVEADRDILPTAS